MVDRVFNRNPNPTPSRVQPFLPAVCSTHINMFVIQVVLLGSWLAGDSFLSLPSGVSWESLHIFKLWSLFCCSQLRGQHFVGPALFAASSLVFAEFTEVIPSARRNQSMCGKKGRKGKFTAVAVSGRQSRYLKFTGQNFPS